MKKFPYEDIVHLSEPELIRPRMTLQQRAAQFMPFAALTGYDEAIAASSRREETRRELSEDEKQLLDEALVRLQKISRTHPSLKAVYYDETAHRYRTVQGELTGCRPAERWLDISCVRIAFDDLFSLQIM
jgi:hypothetical protein